MPKSSKIIVVTATILLSACASVFTFLAMTKIEARLTGGKRSGSGENIPEATVYAGSYRETPAHTEESNITGAAAKTANNAPQTSGIRASLEDDNAQTASPARGRESSPPPSYIPPPAGPSVNFMIDNAPPTLPIFALTFDGGSFANAAGDILDTLASRGVKSTMFVTGEFIRRFPSVVTRIAEEGHELGNHMHRHPRLTSYSEDRTQSTLPGVTRQTVINELNGAAQTLADRTGLRFAPLWRAPYGEYNREICRWALEAGYVHIGWRQGGSWWYNLDTNDWVPNEESRGYKTPEEVVKKITNIAAKPGGLNGGIILMHLGTERKRHSQQVHIILGTLIDTLRGMGYEPVTVSEMLFRTGIDINTPAIERELQSD